MFYTIIDKSNILKYESSDNLFAGLVITDENSLDIFSVYESYIQQILQFYIDTTLQDEQSIESEIKNLCSMKLDLAEEEISEILSAFMSFFLYDRIAQRFLIKRKVLSDSKEEKELVQTFDGKLQLVEFKKQTASLKEISSFKKQIGEVNSKEENGETHESKNENIIGAKNNNFESASAKEQINSENRKSFLKRIKPPTIVVLAIILIFGFAIFAHKNWPLMPDIQDNDSDTTVNEQQATITFNVIDSLQTDGKLIICEDSTISIKYLVSTNASLNVQDVNWDNCEYIAPGTTLYPKENCTIFLRAEPKQRVSDAYQIKTYSFNMCAFVEFLIKSSNNESILNQMLSYSDNMPLTINYKTITTDTIIDKKMGTIIKSDTIIIEDICSTYAEKGPIDILRTSLISEGYHIDSISFYKTNNTDMSKELKSNEYSSIKYILCK